MDDQAAVSSVDLDIGNAPSVKERKITEKPKIPKKEKKGRLR